MLENDDKNTLLELARESIRHGLSHGTMSTVPDENYSAILQKYGACFVTLHYNKQLRGCIGSLSPYQPLVDDVVHNAFNAAFRDPRFNPLRPDEFKNIHIHIEVLGPTEKLNFGSEEELLNMLRPGIDGLVLRENGHTGTFLPSVWSSLPEPEVFLQQLKRKAGLATHFWSENVSIERYTTEAFEEAEQE